MSRPIVIQVIGMHGVGKTTIAGIAAELFAEKGLHSVRLDVDHFAQAFIAEPVDPKLGEPALRKRLSEIVESIKKRVAHSITIQKVEDEKLKKMKGEELLIVQESAESVVIHAVKSWMREQEADIIFLEMHWPNSAAFYPYDAIWMVTAPPTRSEEYVTGSYGVEWVQSAKDLLRWSQYIWRHGFRASSNIRILQNANPDMKAVSAATKRLVDTIITCRQDGRYDDDEEDRITQRPPPEN